MDLSKKVFGANVDKNIREYFQKLQQGTFEIQPGTPIGVSYDTNTYLGDRTSYARMWVAVNVSEVNRNSETKKYERVERGKDFIYSINENLNVSYSELDSTQINNLTSTQKLQLENNPYLKPTAGITSINSKSEGAVGALRRTTVNFTVHNKHDFDNIFLPFFLKPGATVFVDFGWSDKALNLYNPKKFIENTNLAMENFYQEVYKDDGVIGKGFKTTLSGQVTKYDINVDEKGSFNCTLEFVSSNYALLDKTISDDNNLKFLFDNAIEELLMGYFLNFSNINVDFEATIAESSNRLSNEERKTLVRDFFDNNTKKLTVGKIDETSRLSGIFYQQISIGENDEDRLDDKESLYISYGLFEDKFLNQFVSYWITTDDDGNEVERLKSDKPFSNSFSSQNSWARFDLDLNTLQTTKFQDSDEKLSFLYPDQWNNTYNKLKPNGWDKTSTDKANRRIPLRELFISVPTIAEAFRKSQNVNDALEFIFNKIYEDSGNIINIKMIANNDAQSSITFQDVNVEADKFDNNNESILEFDITSGNTIVINSDLKFETPKAGLSSMIAIGNLSKPSFFDEEELFKFNFLNAVQGKQGETKYQVKHLPDYGEPPSNYKALTLDMKKVIGETIQGPPKPNNSTSKDYELYLEERQKIIKSTEENENTEDNKQKNINDEKELLTETDDGRQIFYAKTNRDMSMLAAKINNFIKTDDNSISPVLPVTLSLKIYGNNFLGIGDFFTVNFLPKHYQERVYFQIVGIDHSIGTSMWETTYTTVMRLKSTEKYKSLGDKKDDELIPEIRLHPLYQERLSEEIQKTLSVKENSASKYTIKDIKPIYNKTTTSKFDRPSAISDDDMPTINWSRFDFIWDPDNKAEEIKKLDRGTYSVDKCIISVKRPSILDRGTLAYYLAVTKLILSDELIDWKKTSFGARPRNISEINVNTAKENSVYVIPRTTPSGDLNRIYKQLILELVDTYVDSTFETDIFLDEFQKKIDVYLDLQKLNFSDSIKTTNLFANTNDFMFFDTIVWDVSTKNPFYIKNDKSNGTPFTLFRASGHTDLNVLPDIAIPKALVKQIDIEEKIWREYCGLKEGLKVFFETFEER